MTFTHINNPNARVWIYQADRNFTPQEAVEVNNLITGFVAQWTAHKEQVTGAGAILYNRFVVLMADESMVGVSGCSIDSSVHFIKTVGQKYGINFFDRLQLAYLKGEDVHTATALQLKQLEADGVITPETVVFNNMVATKAEFDTKWQIPYAGSPHQRLAANAVEVPEFLKL
jgi:hypothetical protein